MRQVVIDTNVLVSLSLFRNETQRTKGLELLDRAADSELTVIVPQFIFFEAIHIFRSRYDLFPAEIATLLRELMAFPGITPTADCDWPLFFEHWTDLKPAPIDAAILAVSIANRYTLATFDRKLSNRAKTFGVAPYW